MAVYFIMSQNKYGVDADGKIPVFRNFEQANAYKENSDQLVYIHKADVPSDFTSPVYIITGREMFGEIETETPFVTVRKRASPNVTFKRGSAFKKGSDRVVLVNPQLFTELIRATDFFFSIGGKLHMCTIMD